MIDGSTDAGRASSTGGSRSTCPNRASTGSALVSELMDDPQLTYPTIHVTGTNGKTTIARAAAEIACAHGVTPGLFTSPHLHR